MRSPVKHPGECITGVSAIDGASDQSFFHCLAAYSSLVEERQEAIERGEQDQFDEFCNSVPGFRYIGCASATGNFAKPKQLDPELAELLEDIWPGVAAEFEHPIRNTGQLKRSASEYASVDGITFSPEQHEKAKGQLLKELPRIQVPDDFGSGEWFRRSWSAAVSELKLDSSPGYPYMLSARENGDIVDSGYLEEIQVIVRKRVEDWLDSSADRADSIARSAGSCIQQGLRDPVKVFGKNQGLPIRKNGLPRLICSVSLADQLVERILFTPFCEAVHAEYPKCPVMIGIGFNDEHAKLVGDSFDFLKTLTLNVKSDVSGWEKGFSLHTALLSADVMSACHEGAPEHLESLSRAFRVWATTLVSVPWIFPDGTIWCREVLKIMTSGDFLTSYANSLGRLGVACMVGSVARSVGDDCCEGTNRCIQDLIDAYNALNVRVRDVDTIIPTDFAFCSHRYYVDGDGVWRCHHADPSRMLFEMASKSAWDPASDQSWLDELRYAPAAVRAKFALFVDKRKRVLQNRSGA